MSFAETAYNDFRYELEFRELEDRLRTAAKEKCRHLRESFSDSKMSMAVESSAPSDDNLT